MELSSVIDRLPSMVKVSVSVAILSFFRCKTLIQFKESNLYFPFTKLLYDNSFNICGSFWSKIDNFSFNFPSFIESFTVLWIHHGFCTGSPLWIFRNGEKLEGISYIFLWRTVRLYESIFCFHIKAKACTFYLHLWHEHKRTPRIF